MRATDRHAFELRASPLVSATITNADHGQLPVGNQFGNAAFYYTLKSFYENSSGLLHVYDQYRFKEIEVYAEQVYDGPGVDIHKTVFASVDYDDASIPTWQEMQSRQNVSMTVISDVNPKQVVARFKPVANYVNTNSSSPANLIPHSNEWFDLAATAQRFNGLKVHFEAPGGSTTSLRFSARAVIQFRGKV
jgi:hypothetical protein